MITIQQYIQAFALLDVEIRKEKLFLVGDKTLDRIQRGQKMRIRNHLEIDPMKLASRSEPDEQVVVFGVDRSEFLDSIVREPLADVGRMIDLHCIDVHDCLTKFLQPVGIAFHRSPMEQELLPTESVLPKQERVLNHIDMLDVPHPFRIGKQLMRVDNHRFEGFARRRLGFHDDLSFTMSWF